MTPPPRTADGRIARRASARTPSPPWSTGVIIFVAATLVAAVMSPSVSLWTDEAVTISAAERSLPQLWDLAQRIDAVHTLYYAFMSGWIDVFGASPFSLRLPSALAAGATAWGVYVLCRMLASEPTAILAAAVATMLPRLTWAGIEARPFAFSATAAVWLSVLLVRAADRSTAARWSAYGVLAVLGIAINLYLVLLVLAHLITIAVRRRRVLGAFLIVAIGAGACTIPLVLLVRSQQAQLGGNGDHDPRSIARKIVINQFFLGETPDADTSPAVFTHAWQASAVVACGLGVAAAILAVARPAAPGDRKNDILSLTLPWIVVPTLVVAGYSVAVAPIYQPRYFTFAAPAAAIVIALGARTIRRRFVVVAGATLWVIAVTVIYTSQRTPFAKSGSDWSALASAVSANAQPGDGVYFAPRQAPVPGEPVTLTTRRAAQAYPWAYARLDDLTLIATGAETSTLDGFSRPLNDAEDDLRSLDRVWGVFSDRAPASVRLDSDAEMHGFGYSAVTVWEGPSTTLVLYRREEGGP